MIIFLGLIFLIALVMLQIFLSTRDNKLLGLVLPCINLTGSVLTMILTCSSSNFNIKDIISYVIIFLIYNIPTEVLLMITYLSGKKVNLNSEIEKMHIQDLG